MTTDTGGPVFPVNPETEIADHLEPDDSLVDAMTKWLEANSFKGMTLRDYFAGMAMLSKALDDEPEASATRCYSMADAMIAEKRRTEKGEG